MSETGTPDTGNVTTFIGLGSNLKDPVAQIRRATEALDDIPGCRLLESSRLYQSKPLGPADQPDYVNAVAKLETELPPDRLLDELQSIEKRQGRDRGAKWGPRTLDLDILFYGDRQIESQRLSIPHPGIPHRSFVLWPLTDLLEETTELPGLGRLDALKAACPDGTIETCPDDDVEPL